MSDITFALLAKNAVGDGMANYAAKVGLVLARGLGNVGVGCLPVERNISRDVESADALESQVVEKLSKTAISSRGRFVHVARLFMAGKK